MDRFGPAQRSQIMRRVRAQNTTPERAIAHQLRELGLAYRMHVRALPGKPDFVLPEDHVAIFVHGCFWHQHTGCDRAARPQSNKAFWNRKLDRNIARDRAHARTLRSLGWRVMTVWECRMPTADSLLRRICRTVGGNPSRG
jgi:DNA mismatch endonuclease, patch repair protein